MVYPLQALVAADAGHAPAGAAQHAQHDPHGAGQDHNRRKLAPNAFMDVLTKTVASNSNVPLTGPAQHIPAQGVSVQHNAGKHAQARHNAGPAGAAAVSAEDAAARQAAADARLAESRRAVAAATFKPPPKPFKPPRGRGRAHQ